MRVHLCALSYDCKQWMSPTERRRIHISTRKHIVLIALHHTNRTQRMVMTHHGLMPIDKRRWVRIDRKDS